MKTKREKAAAIVQALLQKTAANGATEAEAMVAAEKALSMPIQKSPNVPK
jgi:hypothetical protein